MIEFLVLFFTTFFGTHYALPHSIRKMKENGFVSIDMYKRPKVKIPTNLGLIVLFTSYISVSLLPLFVRLLNLTGIVNTEINDLTETHLAFLLVVSIFGLYGLVDDLVDIGRKLKLIFPIMFCFPLISVIHPKLIWVPFLGEFDLIQELFSSGISYSDIIRIMVVPIYVMVVSNLVNMHSGYNGLQSGLSIIILSTLIIKSWQMDTLYQILPCGAILGGMSSFWFFNRYPSRAFEGNIGSLLFGSVIGCVIVIQELWWFGFFILLPHTFNFFQWIYWLYLMKRYPKLYLDNEDKHTKFGSVEQDGSIVVPNALTLKWVPTFYFSLDEKNSTYSMYLLTIIFCSVGLIYL